MAKTKTKQKAGSLVDSLRQSIRSMPVLDYGLGSIASAGVPGIMGNRFSDLSGRPEDLAPVQAAIGISAPFRQTLGLAGEGANKGIQALQGKGSVLPSSLDQAWKGSLIGSLLDPAGGKQARQSYWGNQSPVFSSPEVYQNALIDDPYGSAAKRNTTIASYFLNPAEWGLGPMATTAANFGRGVMGTMSNIQGDITRPENLMKLGMGGAVDAGTSALINGLANVKTPGTRDIQYQVQSPIAQEQRLVEDASNAGTRGDFNATQAAYDALDKSGSQYNMPQSYSGPLKPVDALPGGEIPSQGKGLQFTTKTYTEQTPGTFGEMADQLRGKNVNVDIEKAGGIGLSDDLKSETARIFRENNMSTGGPRLTQQNLEKIQSKLSGGLAEKVGNSREAVDMDTVSNEIGAKLRDNNVGWIIDDPKAQNKGYIKSGLEELQRLKDNPDVGQLLDSKQYFQNQLKQYYKGAAAGGQNISEKEAFYKGVRDALDESLKTHPTVGMDAQKILADMSILNKVDDFTLQAAKKGAAGVKSPILANAKVPLQGTVGLGGLRELGAKGLGLLDNISPGLQEAAGNSVVNQWLPQILSRLATNNVPSSPSQGSVQSGNPSGSVQGASTTPNSYSGPEYGTGSYTPILSPNADMNKIGSGLTRNSIMPQMSSEQPQYDPQEVRSWIISSLQNGKTPDQIESAMGLLGISTNGGDMNYSQLAGLSPQQIYVQALNMGKSPAEASNMADNLSGGGLKLTAGQQAAVADGNSAINQLQNLRDSLKASPGLMGPIAGTLGSLNPYDTNAQSLQAQINTAKQVIGKFLEGGVLRKEDEEKYAKILPTMFDTPEVAQNKLDYLSQLMAGKQKEYMMAASQYGGNPSMSGGYSPYGLTSTLSQ